jgi:hypothetical protein
MMAATVASQAGRLAGVTAEAGRLAPLAADARSKIAPTSRSAVVRENERVMSEFIFG